MPVYVTIIGILISIFLTTLGFYFYKKEDQSAIIRYLYVFAASANAHYILFLLPLWREMFSYGLAYFQTLILICIIVACTSDNYVLKDAPLKLFSPLSSSNLNLPEFPLTQLGVYYSIVAIFLLIFCILVYYTSILDEDKFVFVRSFSFIFLNRLIVFIATVFILFFFTSIIYVFTIPYSKTTQIFMADLFFLYEPVDNSTKERLGNLCLILLIPTILTVIRPTSPVRQSLSKICHVLLPFITGLVMMHSSYALYMNSKSVFADSTIYFYPLLIHSTTAFLCLIALLELLLPRRPRSILKNQWAPIAFP